MSEKRRTEKGFWEDYWVNYNKPRRFRPESLQKKELKKIFHKHLPAGTHIRSLEIGGASGEYLLYLHERLQHEVSSLDYSAEGNETTKARFSQAGKEVQIIQRDLFGDLSDLLRFDIVFSLGFIEHFDDPEPSIARHLELLKPGGILFLGVPNLGGIYKWVLKRTAPSMLESHNLKTMELDAWDAFEQKLNLQRIFRKYIGGFEPLNMRKLERRNIKARVLNMIILALVVLISFRFQFLRKWNSPFWSGYMVGIYKKG